MTSLAIDGGKPAVSGRLLAYDSITGYERGYAVEALNMPLSGYLGGSPKGGYYCQKLEEEFADAIGSKYAIVCNSATSGLVAACAAAGVGSDSAVITSPYTMSASAAAPKSLGANIVFGDIEAETFSLFRMWHNKPPPSMPYKAVIVTNLFGHPAKLRLMRDSADRTGLTMIEDCAQSPFAVEHGKHAGTHGHMGICSFNVHKHLQSGEGGIVVTDNEDYAQAVRRYVNHGELAGDTRVGLNLRMTEVTAAIALAQVRRRDALINSRIELAMELTKMVEPYACEDLRLPVTRGGCKHVYYCWPLLVRKEREFFVQALCAEGVPVRAGYVKPLYQMPAFRQETGSWPVTAKVESEIVLFEVCAHDPSKEQLVQMKEAFDKVCTAWHKRIKSTTNG